MTDFIEKNLGRKAYQRSEDPQKRYARLERRRVLGAFGRSAPKAFNFLAIGTTAPRRSEAQS